MNDFSTPRRMSSGAFLILLMKSLREWFGPFFIAILYTLFKSDDSLSGDIKKVFWGIGILLVVSFLNAFFKYYFRKFHIEGDNLIMSHGFASKETTSIPLSRVHTLRSKSGILYRLLDLHGIAFDTLASEKEEVELILNEKDWKSLLRCVSPGEGSVGQPEIPAHAAPPPFEGESLRINNLNIIKGALCQNHLKGFAILAAIAAAVYDNISQLGEEASARVFDYIDGQFHSLVPSAGQCILIAAGIYLFVMILWTGRIFLRYGDMSLRISPRRLTIESGLLSRFTSRIVRDKVSVMAIKQNQLEKIARCQTIVLHQAANVSGSKMEKDIRIYGSDLGKRLLGWWLGETPDVDDKAVMSARSGRGLFMRKFFPHLILAAAVLVLLLCAEDMSLPAIIICSVYSVLMAVRAAMAWRHSRIEIYEDYARIYRGNIAHISEYIKFEDMESVMIQTTPLSYRTRRVSLHISTNAGVATVRSLKSDKASEIRDFLLLACYRNQRRAYDAGHAADAKDEEGTEGRDRFRKDIETKNEFYSI